MLERAHPGRTASRESQGALAYDRPRPGRCPGPAELSTIVATARLRPRRRSPGGKDLSSHFPPSPRRVPAVDRRPDVRRQVRRVVCVGMTRSSRVPIARARFSGVWLSTTTTALGPAPSAKNVPTSEHRSHPGHPTTPAPVKEGLELAGRRIGKVWPSRAHLSTQPAERCWIDSASGLEVLPPPEQTRRRHPNTCSVGLRAGPR